MAEKIKKVLLLTNIPRPYRIPFFNYLSGVLKRDGIDFEVLFYSSLKDYPERRERIDYNSFNFNFSFLKHTILNFGGRKFFFIKDFKREILKREPDVLIVGNLSTVFYQVSGLSIKKILWAGSFGEIGRFKNFFRKFLLKGFDAIISYSTKSREYFSSLGFPEERIFVAINSVDRDFFRIEDFQKKIFDRLEIVYSGKLNRRKGVFLFPKIFKNIKYDFHLHIVGEGNLRESLEKEFEKMGLMKKVTFYGFLQPEELRNVYHMGNLFLFLTFRDPWGLVINEAMAGGMGIISSIYAGATFDLVFDGVNGFRVNPENINDVCNKINLLGRDMSLLEEFGKNSLQIVEDKTGFEKMAESFLRAIFI